MFGCPNCNTRLSRVTERGRVEFACARCRGRMLGTSLVRRLADEHHVRTLWTRARSAPAGVGCPCCCDPMGEVSLTTQAGALSIDVCVRCHVLWFDRGEVTQLSRLPRDSGAPPAAVTGIDISPPPPPEAIDLGTTNPWQRLAHHLGAPVEHDGAASWLPVTTLSVALLMLIGALLPLAVPGVGAQLGLSPAEPFRLAGLPLLVAPLLQESLLAGIANLLCFVYLADNVEQFLGGARMLVLIALAALAGQVGHLLTTSPDGPTLVGSDGILTAVAVVFGLSFFRARLDLLLGFHRPWHLISFPAWSMIGLCAVWTLAEMLSGATVASFGVHGAAAAVAVAAHWTFHDRAPAT